MLIFLFRPPQWAEGLRYCTKGKLNWLVSAQQKKIKKKIKKKYRSPYVQPKCNKNFTLTFPSNFKTCYDLIVLIFAGDLFHFWNWWLPILCMFKSIFFLFALMHITCICLDVNPVDDINSFCIFLSSNLIGIMHSVLWF